VLGLITHSEHTLRSEKERNVLVDLSLALTGSERETKLAL